MKRHESFLLVLLIIFGLFILLNKKHKLKGGLNICDKSTIINKNFENKFKKILISDFQINKTDLETKSYENLSTLIKAKIAEKSNKTKQDIETRKGEIKTALESAFSYTFDKPYEQSLTGGYYTLCDTNNNISSNKYNKLFKLVYTEILSHKKQLEKLAKLKLSSSLEQPASVKNSFYTTLLTYLVPQNESGEKHIHGSRGTIFGRSSAGNGGVNINGNKNDYKIKVNYNYQADDIDTTQTSGALNFLFFNWEIGTPLDTEKKMKILAACYKYLFGGLPLVSVTNHSTGIRTNIFFNKKITYNANATTLFIEEKKTLDYQNNEHVRECISFDIDNENLPTNTASGLYHHWFKTGHPSYYNNNLIKFYDDIDSIKEATNHDNGFFIEASDQQAEKKLYLNLGINLQDVRKALLATASYKWIRLGNIVLPKTEGVGPSIDSAPVGTFSYTIATDREPEIIKN